MSFGNQHYHPSWKSLLLLCAILVLLLLPASLPAANAQEATEEPITKTGEPTDTTDNTENPEATDSTLPPSPPPDEPETETITPEPEVTEEVTQSTSVPQEATEDPTTGETTEAPPSDTPPETTNEPAATEPAPAVESFAEAFEAFTGAGWTIDGWQLVTSDQSNYLASQIPGARAGISGFNEADVNLTARLRIAVNNTAAIAFRIQDNDEYRVLFSTNGSSRLYRGDAILASGLIDTGAAQTEPQWFTVNIIALGDTIGVSINGTPVIAYTDAVPLGAGQVAFRTGTTNAGEVALDDVAVQVADPNPVIASPPSTETEPATEVETTPEVTAEPEGTTEPEVTAEPETTAEAEITPEAEATAEAEVTPEAETTAEPDTSADATEVAPILTADFEAEMDDWLNNGGSVVAVDETNSALLLTALGSFLPVDEALTLSDYQIDGQFQILTETAEGMSGVSLSFGDYKLNFSTTGVVLSDADGVLSTAEDEYALNTWVNFSLRVQGNNLVLTVDDLDTMTFSGENMAGSFAFEAVSSVMLDNLAVFDFAPVDEQANDDGLLSEAAANKLSGNLLQAIQLHIDGESSEALVWLDALGYEITGTSDVIVQIRVADGFASQPVIALITELGGTVISDRDPLIEAAVAVESLIPLANTGEIDTITRASNAVSTGNPGVPPGEPAGATVSAGFDMLGIQDWHTAGITGTGVTVGIIDTGFEGTQSVEHSCLSTIKSSIAGQPLGVGNHGLLMTEILCDVAPDANIIGYATRASTLADSINLASFDNVDVLVIALDIGAEASPGDGFGTNNPLLSGVRAPYTALEAASGQGMVIFSAAGNSGQPGELGAGPLARISRYITLNIPANQSEVITLNLRATAADVIFFSWNDWGGRLGSSAVPDPGDISTNQLENFEVVLDEGSFQVEFTGLTAQRTRALEAPAGSLGVPSLGTCKTLPGVDPPTCDLTLEITRTSGDSAVIMQIQIAPDLFTPTQIGNEPETFQQSDVRFLSIDPSDSALALSNVGSMARPADSPNVIAVGAVCANPEANLAPLFDTSVGPVYDLNGDAPTIANNTQSTAKPDIVSPSYVDTSLTSLITPGHCTDSVTSDVFESENGFGGTSAAAAHAAGLAALAKSNTTNASMNTNFNTDNAGSFKSIRDYLQAHAADLPLGDQADGFDQTFGAGFAVLGSPDFNINNVLNPTLTTDVLSCAGDHIFVGQGQLGVTPTGSQTAPYTHIPFALNQAQANDCVIVMPGEYVTPMHLENLAAGVALISYDQATSIDFQNTILRTVNSYYNGDGLFSGSVGADSTDYVDYAGLYLDNLSNFTISGFNVVPATARTLSTPPGLIALNGTNININSNYFGAATVDGVTYPGWVGRDATPLSIFGGSNHLVDNNVFAGSIGGFNATDGRYYYPGLAIVDAGSDGSTVVISNNNFANNQALEMAADSDFWGSVTYAGASFADFVNNAFDSNNANTLINGQTALSASTEELRVVSNVFLNNTLGATQNGVSVNQAGPMVHAYFVGNLSFMNNTVVRNIFTGSDVNYRSILGRGNRKGTLTGGGGNTPQFDFFNNLTTNNTNLFRIYADSGAAISSCDDLSGSSNRAIQFNWHINADESTCATALNDPGDVLGNNNETGIDPNPHFIGVALGSLTVDDVNYYGLRPQDLDAGIFNYGIDGGNPALGTDVSYGTPPNNPSPPNPPFEFDITGEQRVNPVADWELNATSPDTNTFTIDTGAFEFNPLQILIPNLAVPNVEEDTFPIVVDLDPQAVVGGFGDLTFELISLPDNFGTQCGDQYTLANHGTFFGQGANSDTLFYCPPADFFTTGSSAQDIVIDYRVTDEAAISDEGIVTIPILPLQDQPLTAVIGDGLVGGQADESDTFQVVGNLGTTVNVRLRPFVRFNNFRFSEANNPEFGSPGSFQIDYDFTFSNIQEIDPENIIKSVSLTNGVLSIEFEEGDVGEASITYDVTDSFGNTTTGNTLSVRTVNRIPTEPGIYDDASFAFDYSDASGDNLGEWIPVENDGSINNTLHRTTGEGDVARFGFRGTGFVLYMQAEGRGNLWDLVIDGIDDGAWTTVSSDVVEASIAGFNCTTSDSNVSPDGFGGPLVLNNRGRGGYTVTCQDAANEEDVYLIELHNRNARAQLSVDAFSIIDDQDGGKVGPLGPGTHDVNEDEIRDIFDGTWIETANRRYSNGIGYVYTNTGTPATDLSFTIKGGTGFAFGTTLERTSGTYTICVTDLDADGGDIETITCQDFDNRDSRPTFDVFRPFYGLDPNHEYQIDLTNINMDLNGQLVFDSLVVFPETDATTAALPGGPTSPQDVELFVLGGGLEDSWTLNTIDRRAADQDLIELQRRVTAAGPYIAFDVDEAIDTLYWTFEFTRRASQNTLICVDRGAGISNTAATAYGNCVQVDLTTGDFSTLGADGTLNPAGNMALVDGTLIIDEADFSRTWTGYDKTYDGDPLNTQTVHTFEIFSLENNAFSLDELVAIGSGVPLPGGFYEEYVPNIKYFQTGDFVTPVDPAISDSPRSNDWANPFTRVTGRAANRDSGGGFIYTSEVGNVIHFEFEGTGFAPTFRLDRTADTVEVCWLKFDPGAPTVQQILDNGDCERFDNENRRPSNIVERMILGLESAKYGATVQLTGDNFVPDANRFAPVSMWFDGVAIFDKDFTGLTPLTLNERNEASFERREVDNKFIYFGPDWESFSGPRASRYSAQDYDTIRRGDAGAAVAFRVAGANAISYIRDLSNRLTPLHVCAINESTQARRCIIVDNSGRGFENELTIYLSDDQAIDNYLVTMTAQEDTTFNFDAVRPLAIIDPLMVGKYDDSHPAIIYEDYSRNLVRNGGMEADNGAEIFWTAINSPALNQQGRPSYDGRFSRELIGGGIQSLPFDLAANETYKVLARVNIDPTTPGTVTMTVKNGATLFQETVDITGGWVSIEGEINETADAANVFVEFNASAGTVHYFVDDVHVERGGNWEINNNRRFFAESAHRSTTHGAEAAFRFEGTGFSVGTHTDRFGGEMRICWLGYTTTVPTNGEVVRNGTCMTYENENRRTNTTTQRLITGLSDGKYAVVITDVEDGATVTGRNFGDARNARMAVGQMVIDFVEIFNNALPAPVPAGSYNDADFVNGERPLQLLPPESWRVITGRAANRFSEETYTTVIDDRFRDSRNHNGPTALLNLAVPANSEATVILDTNAANRRASDQLLACIGEPEGLVDYDGTNFFITDVDAPQNCVLLDDMTEAQFITLNKANLPMLENTTGSTVNQPLILQSLADGEFKIDGYQVLYGAVLTKGFYEDSIGTNALVPSLGTWTTSENNSFSGGTALSTTDATGELTFDIQGTGVSVVTAHQVNGGAITVNVTGGGINIDRVVDTRNGANVFGAAVTIAGLPSDTYTVTVTANNDAGESVVVDAVTVYGTLQQLGSLYDDNQVDIAGDLLITYGPTNDSWTETTGSLASGALNETLHLAQRFGAVASFEIGSVLPSQGIVLYYDNRSNVPTVDVCFRDPSSPATETCETVTVNDNVGRKTVLAPAAGNYFVTILNDNITGTFALDAVQVLEQGTFEGIFDDVYLAANAANADFTHNVANQTIDLANGQSYSINDVNGIGISFVIENATSGYNVTLTDGGAININDNLPLAGDSGFGGRIALTYTGLHDGSGDDNTLTATLTNNSAGTLRIVELHVLGDNDTLNFSDTTRKENSDPEIRYLPFGSLNEDIDKRGGASEFSQHEGQMQGSLAYFEFTGDANTGFDYLRQTNTGFGAVEICFGQVGTDNLSTARPANCQTTQNNLSNTFQVAEPIDPSLDCSSGCWATVRNVDGSLMPFDFVRLADATAPLEAGFYEENYRSLTFEAGVGNGWTNEIDNRASGGFVQRITVDDGLLTATNGPTMSFPFKGTGFSVFFTANSTSDAAEICYDDDSDFDEATDTGFVQICQSFDNENRRTTNTIARTISGLPFGDYHVRVRMLRDNLDPAPHNGRALPLTMEIDAVQIYGTETENWTDLNLLTPGMRYETSFDNRFADNNFEYIGDGWSSVEGARARRNSGSNYDTVREYGAAVTFQTNNADAVTIFTDRRRNFAPLRVCVAPFTGGTPAVNGPISCNDYSMDGRGQQLPFSFQFADFGDAAASSTHSVSITTLDNGILNLDAIEVSTSGALEEGFYEATNSSIFYDRSNENLIYNGDMEADSNWHAVPDGLDIAQQNGRSRFTGRFGLLINDTITSAGIDPGTGVESDAFAAQNVGTIYSVVARVRVQSGGVQMQLVEENTFNSIAEFTDQTAEADRNWQTLRFDFVLESARENLRLQFLATQPGTIFDLDDVSVSTGGDWGFDDNQRLSADSAVQSSTHGASVQLAFTGTGVQIGAPTDRAGGEVEMCVDDDAAFDEVADGTPQSCITLEQEDRRGSLSTTRTIAGLPLGTYYVRLRDVEDGFTTTRRGDAAFPRSSRDPIGQIQVDFVRVLNETLAPVLPAGIYNEDARDSNLNPYLQLLPGDEWGSISGRQARQFSSESYVTVMDDRGRANSRTAGQAAMLNVEVPPEGATVVLFTGPASRRNTDQLLICADGSLSGQISWDGFDFSLLHDTLPANCTLRDITESNAVAIGGDELAALAGGASTNTVPVMFTSLTEGSFNIDGYQLIQGDVLTAGLYDDFLPDNLLDFNTNSAALPDRVTVRGCDVDNLWCEGKSRGGFGGTTLNTQSPDATLQFNIEGTGFSVVTGLGSGTDMRICYQRTPLNSLPTFPDTSATIDDNGHVLIDNNTVDVAQGDVWCDIVTTNSNNRFRWDELTPDRINPRRGDQYGFAYYGLPFGQYTVEVRMVDQSLTNRSRNTLDIDAIAVFSDSNDRTPLAPGLYDDTTQSISYEPAPFWIAEESRNGPPRGPFQQTEHTTSNAGSIAQMLVDGNALTIFQTVDGRNTDEARICLIVTGTTIHCTVEASTSAEAIRNPVSPPPYALAVELANFSQRGRRSFFTPILFYGLGETDTGHQIIVENRDHGRAGELSIDAVLVQE